MSIANLIKTSKKIQNLAKNSKYTADYLRRAKLRDKKINPNRKKGGLYSYPDEFLKNFSEAYKTLDAQGIGSLKQGMNSLGSNFWETTKKAAKKKGYITAEDANRIQQQRFQAFKEQDYTNPKYKPKQNIREEKRNAIKSVWEDIVNSAPKNSQTKLPIISGVSEFYPIKIIPKLKNKYPDLFKDIENNVAGRSKMNHLIEATESGSFPLLKYPKFQKSSANIDEEAMYSQVTKFTDEEELGKIPRQYLIDVFRSRPSEFMTGNYKNDANRYLRFLRGQGFFDPQSDYFFKKNPEFIDYLLTRKQPSGSVANYRRGQDLSHDVPTLATEGSKKFPTQTQTIPFSGGEIGNTHYLPKNINRVLQPKLETQAIDALVNENFDLFKKLDQQMTDNNIRTTIIHPITKEKFPMGGWKDTGFSGGGLVKLLNKLKLTDKQKELIKRTAFNEKKKPGTGPKALREERIKKKIREKYGKEKKWTYVKSKIEGPKSSLQRKKDKEFFDHTEFWTEKKKKAKGGIVSFYVR